MSLGRNRCLLCREQTELGVLLCGYMVIDIDKPVFDRSTEQERIRLLLNASVILIKYLAERAHLPKNFNGKDMAIDYKRYLAKNNLLIDVPICIRNNIIGENTHQF